MGAEGSSWPGRMRGTHKPKSAGSRATSWLRPGDPSKSPRPPPQTEDGQGECLPRGHTVCAAEQLLLHGAPLGRAHPRPGTGVNNCVSLGPGLGSGEPGQRGRGEVGSKPGACELGQIPLSVGAAVSSSVGWGCKQVDRAGRWVQGE